MAEKREIDTIKKSFIGQEALHSGRRLANIPRKGGEAYAYYVTYRQIHRYDNCKKQQPPLSQVTVVC